MPGKKIHIVAIGGTGMSALAGMLKERGFEISGSDKGLYPPASTLIQKLGISVNIGYSSDNIPKDTEMAIIGNAVSKDNPEVIEILNKNIPYMSFPQSLWEYFIKGKKSVVVAGTHGKTTAASAVSWVLYSMGYDPGYMIGGVPKNFNSNFRIGSGLYFVSEGDEYDSAYFDKGPKFLHYFPDYLLLNSVEFDHADIYRDLGHVMLSFYKLIDLVNINGAVSAFGDNANVRKLLKKTMGKTATFGFENRNDMVIKKIKEKTGEILIHRKNGADITFKTELFGDQNYSNLTGALLLCELMGCNISKAVQKISGFKGVQRRQEHIGSINNIDIYDDFAHHPTAVRLTLNGFRNRHANRRLVAVFEPRSNSSRRNIFEEEYVKSFDDADIAIISDPFNKAAIGETMCFSTEKVVKSIRERGKEAFSFKDADSIADFLKDCLIENDIVVIMSNGDFGGLHKKLIEVLEKRDLERKMQLN